MLGYDFSLNCGSRMLAKIKISEFPKYVIPSSKDILTATIILELFLQTNLEKNYEVLV